MVEDHNKENKVVVDLQRRWKMIISKLEQIPSRLSDLSSHPCFSKNMLCIEQLQTVSKTLNEALEIAEKCSKEKYEGKLQMQSDLDALSGKIDLNLRDCGLLIKTGVLGKVSLSSCTSSGSEGASSEGCNITELLARMQIGHLEAKHKALDCLADVMREDEKMVLPLRTKQHIRFGTTPYSYISKNTRKDCYFDMYISRVG